MLEPRQPRGTRASTRDSLVPAILLVLGLLFTVHTAATETDLEDGESEQDSAAPYTENEPPARGPFPRAADTPEPATGPGPEVRGASPETKPPGAVADAPAAADSPEQVADEAVWEPKSQPMQVLGKTINPGQHRRLDWNPSGYAGLALKTPVQVVHGIEPGPVLCLTAAIHGDELNGVEIVRRVVHKLDPLQLHGTVIAVPIVNLQGFLRNSRYLPDRRDLNRHFPGNPSGSSARRIAHSLFRGVITHCNALIDLHTGSFHRSNLPQLRADLNNEAVLDFTHGFGSMVVLHVNAQKGTLRRAAMDAGIAAVTLEAGAPMHLDEQAVEEGVQAIEEVLNHLGLVPRFRLWRDPQPLYYRSVWIRPSLGGILFTNVELGEKVSKGDVLGTVADPIRNEEQSVFAPVDGRILGMALNQMVMPGFAAFHLGVSEGSRLRPVTKAGPEAPDAEEEDPEEAGDDPSE